MKVDAVVCEFRLVCGAGRDADVLLARVALPAVPAAGELVNIDGDPYVVHERGWAFGVDPDAPAPAPTPFYCFLRVCRLQAPRRAPGGA